MVVDGDTGLLGLVALAIDPHTRLTRKLPDCGEGAAHFC